MDDIILNDQNYEEIRTQIYAYAIKEYWIMARRIAKELRKHRKLDIYLKYFNYSLFDGIISFNDFSSASFNFHIYLKLIFIEKLIKEKAERK